MTFKPTGMVLRVLLAHKTLISLTSLSLISLSVSSSVAGGACCGLPAVCGTRMVAAAGLWARSGRRGADAVLRAQASCP